MTSSHDFIQILRAEIRQELREELLQELMPIVEQRLFSNVFDLAEAAKYLKVSQPTVRRMVADKQIPFFRQRGQYFFRQTDLDSHINSLVQQGGLKKAR